MAVYINATKYKGPWLINKMKINLQAHKRKAVLLEESVISNLKKNQKTLTESNSSIYISKEFMSTFIEDEELLNANKLGSSKLNHHWTEYLISSKTNNIIVNKKFRNKILTILLIILSFISVLLTMIDYEYQFIPNFQNPNSNIDNYNGEGLRFGSIIISFLCCWLLFFIKLNHHTISLLEKAINKSK